MKVNIITRKVARKIIGAIIQGAYTSAMIIKNQHLEAYYPEFCKAIAWLQIEGIIESNEFGYNITKEGWSRI